MRGENDKNKGKRNNQKLKPYLVLQILLKNTDETHCLNSDQIISRLEDYGIEAENRSIYRDIADINKALYAEEYGCDLDEAAEAIQEDEENKAIRYNAKEKGFHVVRRKINLNDVRLLAESVYSAKFIPHDLEQLLIDAVCEFTSRYEKETIRRESLVVDRVKTVNKQVLGNIETINEALRNAQKIKFKYTKYDISHLDKLSTRRGGSFITASPFQLLIENGNYYLFAYDGEAEKVWPYRVDRMQNIRILDEPRDGEDAFLELDIKRYTRRVFSMFAGERITVQIRFVNTLLDTVVDRFGTEGVTYSKSGDSHFNVTAPVEVSDQFFAWVCGFRKRAKIIGPPRVVEQMKEFVEAIQSKYDE